MPLIFRNPWAVLGISALVLALTMGIRHSFGVFLPPLSASHGGGREVFAFALAMQNLMWGVAQPFAGMLADRYGAGRTMAGGALLYAIGLYAMATAQTPEGVLIGGGLLIGIGLSGTTFTVVLAAISRAVSPERRSLALGAGAALGSFGQFAMLPVALGLIGSFGALSALLVLAAVVALLVPLTAALVEPPPAHAEAEISIGAALAEATGHRGFWLLCFGFFVCGFQVIFIAVHLPAYLVDGGLSLAVGTAALALVGLFNIFGTYAAGWLGSHYGKPQLLAGVYLLRTLVIVLFLLVPLSAASTYLFAAAIGLFWLSTVPLTNGTVATIFGVKNMSMLTGIVFFFHQVGAFLGAWAGGMLFDHAGSYDLVWGAAIGLGVAATLVNLPIREVPVARLAARPN
jgi:MFS family permease